MEPAWNSKSDEDLLAESYICKGTSLNNDVLVQRKTQLYRTKFVTYHDSEKDPTATKIWLLDSKCQVKPSLAKDIKAVKKYIRPRGTWSITAAFSSALPSVDIYSFKIVWPASWAASGYASFNFGFESLEEAEKWHGLIQDRCIGFLGAERSRRKLSSLNKGSIASESVASSNIYTTSTTPSDEPADPAEEFMDAEAEAESDTDSDCGSLFEETEPGEGMESQGRNPWVPYRQTNGIAIYYHEMAPEDNGTNLGGEYMVSTVIRGSPRECAKSLIRGTSVPAGGSATTILGPAAHVEVLKKRSAECHKEIIRIVLTACGYAGIFCAPREMVVEQLVRQEEDGVVLILFRSLPESEAAAAQSSAGAGAYGGGIFKKPVRGHVQGGYTIAGVRGCKSSASCESLVTCIIKVDFGGICGRGSHLRWAADMVGWTDRLLDRVLMSVTLLRDEVEQRRFSLRPFALVSDVGVRMDLGRVQSRGSGEHSQVAQQQEDEGEDAAATVAVDPGTPRQRLSRSLSRSQSSARALPRLADGAARMHSARFFADNLTAEHSEKNLQTDVSTTVVASSTDETSPSPMLTAAPVFEILAARKLALLPRDKWDELHVPGLDAPFSVRGPTYLKDRRKEIAGTPQFVLAAVDLVELPAGPIVNLARFLPSVQSGSAAFWIIVNLVIPGTPMLSLACVFGCDKHPRELGQPPADPMGEAHDWAPFDFALHKFVYGSDQVRNGMLKLIPHIAEGSWMIRQSVGAVPVLLGTKLKTEYTLTDKYLEVDVDVSANSVANYVTGMVRGTTKSLVVDLGFVLEGAAPWELPECLLGCLRLNRLDCHTARRLDMGGEASA